MRAQSLASLGLLGAGTVLLSRSSGAMAFVAPAWNTCRGTSAAASLRAKKGFGEGAAPAPAPKPSKKAMQVKVQSNPGPQIGGFPAPDAQDGDVEELNPVSRIAAAAAATAEKNQGKELTEEEKKMETREMLRNMGVQSAYDNFEKDTNIPVPKAGEEVMVTMFDVMPMSIQNGFETLLKVFIGIGFLFFFVDGLAIAWEAFAVSTNSQLPGNAKSVIDDVLFPLFTPSLLATLACSSVLGLFKLGQFQKAGTEYRED